MSRGLWTFMSARTRRSLTLLWTALFVCSLALQYVQLAAPALTLAADLPDTFELDGNPQDSATAGDDWQGGTGGAFASAFIDDVTGLGDDIFTEGGSKDVNDITEWERAQSATTSVQDKNDIDHAFAAAYNAADGDLLVYFGLDRYAQNGDAQVGFWFLRDQIDISGSSFGAQHSVGDVLVQIDFENGGTDPIARVYEWNGSGITLVSSGASCASVGSGDRCAISNTATIPSAWSFDPKTGADDTYAPGHFVEGGINLTDLGLDDGCFSTFFAETRSSQSEDSTLSDYAFGSFPLCETPDIATQVKNDQGEGDGAISINKGESVTDHVVVTGSKGEATGTVDIFVCGPTDSAQDCDSGGTQVGDDIPLVDGAADSESFTPSAIGWYCFRAEYTPAAGSKYLAASHTNSTSECVRVKPADVRIVKTPNDGIANAGESISFKLQWGNVGEGKATGVVVTDDLPGDPGLDWSITGFTGTGSTCAISGAVGSETLTCNVGAIDGNTPASTDDVDDDTKNSGSVTLTSGTTPASCGVVDNTGRITSANDGTNTNAGQITVQCPDIKVTKTPDGGSANAGDTITWTITVENLGPGTATGVLLTDELPAAADWSESEADCSISGPVGDELLSCTVGTLASGASKTYTVTGSAGAEDCGLIDNTASATATNEPSGALGNNSDDGDVTVRCADIDIEKTADPAGPVSAGDGIGFDIVVSNLGDGIATGVSVSDELPGTAGLDWSIAGVTGDTTGVTCAIDGALGAEILTCSDPSMAAGDSFTVRVVSGTTSASCASIDNTASVTTLNDGEDTDDATVTVLCPDVTVLKTADDSPINAGDTAAYTITVSNAGPGVAKAVTLSDPLPAGISWSEDSADCSIAANVLTCSFGDLAVGASEVVHLSGLTDAADCGTLPNQATVTAANEAAAQTGNNVSSASIVVECPDVTVVKTGNGPISAGQTATFTIVLSNPGPGDAYGVTLTDDLPAGDWSLGGADAAACDIVAGVLTCDFGTVLAGDDRTITVSKVSDADDCSAIPNDVTVGASNEAPAQTGNNDDDATIVVDCPDLQVVKDGNGPISAGENAVFSLTVTNLGPGVAFDVTLEDDLPAGVAWTLGGPNAAQCSIDTAATPDALSCSFGTLAVGASRSVTLTGETDAADCGTIPNSATVAASNEHDDDLANNEDDASIVVDCPLIVITKSADDPVVNAGDEIGFVIEVTNTGDGSAFGVTVSDTLPAGFTWAESPDAAGWTIAGGVLSFGPATLAGGASTSVHIVAVTDAADCGLVPNTAFLTYQGGTDDDDAEVRVDCPDVSVVKSGNGPLGNGDTAMFTITVTNHGPGDAYDVDLADQLPAGDWTLGGDDAADCAIDGANTLTCAFGTIEAEEDRSITVSRTVSTADCGVIPNEVSVGASNEAADDTANNTDDATIEVVCAFGLLIDKSNDAPIEVIDLPDGSTIDLPTADEGETVTYTLVYDLVDDPVTDAVITDVLPAGVTYVDGSAMGDAQFTFVSYDDATRTLTWTAPSVSDDGSVSYQAVVDEGASELAQPLVNVAVIDSEETEPDDDDSEVFVPTVPLEATGTPKITLPPTDTLATPQGTSNPGFSLMLILLALAAVVVVVGFVTPVPASVRERSRR